MLPRPLPEPFDSDEHLFEPWWGGERALVVDRAGRAAGRRRRSSVRRRRRAATCRRRCPSWPGWPSGSPRGRRSSTASWSSSTPPGRADRAELARRLAGEPGRPVAFLAFDLLHLDGRSLLSQPLVRRREALRRVLRPGDEVVAVPGDRHRGQRAVRGGRRPGHRRDPGPPAREPVPARGAQPAVAVRRGHARSAAERAADAGDEVEVRGADRGGRPGPGADQPAAAPTSDWRQPGDSGRAAPPRRTRATPAAARRAGRPPRTSGVATTATTAIAATRSPIDSATSHGSTAETISRASITNGLNGGSERRDRRRSVPRPAAERDDRDQVADHRHQAERQRQRLEVVGPADERAHRGVDQGEQREPEQEEHAVGREQGRRQADQRRARDPVGPEDRRRRSGPGTRAARAPGRRSRRTGSARRHRSRRPCRSASGAARRR